MMKESNARVKHRSLIMADVFMCLKVPQSKSIEKLLWQAAICITTPVVEKQLSTQVCLIAVALNYTIEFLPAAVFLVSMKFFFNFKAHLVAGLCVSTNLW